MRDRREKRSQGDAGNRKFCNEILLANKYIRGKCNIPLTNSVYICADPGQRYNKHSKDFSEKST